MKEGERAGNKQQRVGAVQTAPGGGQGWEPQGASGGKVGPGLCCKMKQRVAGDLVGPLEHTTDLKSDRKWSPGCGSCKVCCFVLIHLKVACPVAGVKP